jgi:hypothetical protein
MPATTRTIHDFPTAVRTVLALHQLYGRFAAVALLDLDDQIIDMTPFSGEAACVMCAVEWSLAFVHADRRARRAVVLSGADELAPDLREDDVRLFQSVRHHLEALDVQVRDWLQTDGAEVRSLAMSCDVEPAWRGDIEP